MKSVPNFALYGIQPTPSWEAAVHFERIPERSSVHQWAIASHTHDALIQVLYITHGQGEAVMDEQRWPLRSPCLVIVPAGTVHSFRFEPAMDGPVITAAQRPIESLATLVAPELLAQMREPAVLAVEPEGDHALALTRLFDAIARESSLHALGHSAAAQALMLAVFVEISRVSHSAHATADLSRSRKAAQIERFRRLLDQWCRKRASVADYAQALGVTTGHLTRMCREVMGMSALDAINARLIHEARRELVYSTLSIKQVADELGFEDEAYFGRLFKRHTGQRPTEFRASARRELGGG